MSLAGSRRLAVQKLDARRITADLLRDVEDATEYPWFAIGMCKE
jgi:lysozyme family protein